MAPVFAQLEPSAASIAYYLLQREIIKVQGADGLVARAVGNDVKGKISPAMNIIAIPGAYVNQWIAGALYVAVALMWLLPDRRIERVLADASTAR